jgi:hypothetical protein
VSKPSVPRITKPNKPAASKRGGAKKIAGILEKMKQKNETLKRKKARVKKQAFLSSLS